MFNMTKYGEISLFNFNNKNNMEDRNKIIQTLLRDLDILDELMKGSSSIRDHKSFFEDMERNVLEAIRIVNKNEPIF